MTATRRGGLADDISSYIRGRILAGEMKPGEKVDQDAVAQALDVSRSPIREAIVVLGQEGLLDVTPRRGAFVADLTIDDVIDHYELYGLVSGRVAAKAAIELTDDQVDELKAMQSRFVAAGNQEHTEINNKFHRLINSAASRRTLWLLRHLERSIPSDFYGTTPGWGQKAVAGHAVIVEAIIDRDSEAARLAMERHLHEAGVAAADALAERGFWLDRELR